MKTAQEKVSSTKKPNSKSTQVIGGIVAVVFMLGILIAVANNSGNSEANNSLSDDDYVDICQTEIINNRLVDTSTIALTNVLDFNSKVQDTQRKNGDKIIHEATWNGKNKSTDTTVYFACNVSGNTRDDATVHYASAIMDNIEVFQYGDKDFNKAE